MVQFGRHLRYVRQRLNARVFLVDYALLCSLVNNEHEFTRLWQESLQSATRQHEELADKVWSTVFEGSSDYAAPAEALRRTCGDAAGTAEAVLEQLEQRVLPEGVLAQRAVGHTHAIDGHVGSQGAARTQYVEGRAPAWGEGGELGGGGQRQHGRVPPRPPLRQPCGEGSLP